MCVISFGAIILILKWIMDYYSKASGKIEKVIYDKKIKVVDYKNDDY